MNNLYSRTPLSRTAVIVSLLFILALAAFFRFWRLEQMPPGLYHDEAYNGLDALSLVQGKTFPQFYEGWELYQSDAHANRPPLETRWPLFFEGNYGREPLHIYLMAFSIKLFGPTPFAIRAVPALFGILAVFTTFLAAKALLGIKDWRPETRVDKPLPNLPFTIHHLPFTLLTPLIAAFAVAILFPAVHFSRFGLRVMVFVPVETLAVYCFWKALNHNKVTGWSGDKVTDRFVTLSPCHLVTRSTLWFILAGLLLGLGLYIYAAARLFPLLFVIFGIFLLWRQRQILIEIWSGLVLMAGAAFLIALPLLIFFWQYPYFFLFRIAYVSNKGKGAIAGRPYLTWLNNIWRVLAGLFVQGETHLRHNLPGRPYLDLIQSIFFFTGILAVVKQLFIPRIFFLFTWLVIMLLPTILSGDAPHFGRMTGALPVIAIFIGLGVEWIGRRLSAISPRSPITVYRLLITLLLASAIWTAYDYFIRYASHPQTAVDFYLPEWQMGQYAATMPDNASIYLLPTQEELATLYYALTGPERLQNVAGGAIPAGVPGREVLYLLRPSETTILKKLQSAFPDGQPGEAAETYVPFHLPANEPRYLTENVSHHTFADQIQLAGWTVKEDNGSLIVALEWQALKEMPLDYTAFVQLLGQAGQPAAQLDRQPAGHPTSNWRQNELILDEYTINLPPDLPDETYTLQTGFYYLPTLERLGEAAKLGDWRTAPEPVGGLEIGD